MRRLIMCLAVLICSAAAARAAAPDSIWLTVDGSGYRLLKSIQPDVRALAIRRSPLSPGRVLDVDADTRYVVAASRQLRDRLAQAVHQQRGHCGGFMAFDDERSALTALNPVPLAVVPTRPDYSITEQARVLPLLGEVSASRIGSDIQSLSAFHNRYYDASYGADAADAVFNQWQSLAAGRSDIHVEKVFRSSNGVPLDLMPSVRLTIDGSLLPQQRLVLGAHLDSINHRDRDGLPVAAARAPGADDNASGVASLTEVLRVLLAHDFHPHRQLEFIAYSGEEVGLLGSHFIAADYASRQLDVVGVLQLDMTDYQGSAADIVLIDDYTDATQNAFLASLATTYLPHLLVAHSQCGYACSDHFAWNQRGYAASFPFEAKMGEDNPEIHSSRDTWATLGNQATHAQKFSRLALAWMVELSADADDVIFANGLETVSATLAVRPRR
ncbi:MAG TPA: M20/M25/M40 family metallo-hydrolase [Rhodanobacteraceae bacterium]|nr:M20/M25/M40 family metallo-hydrolase [Rhodanobacteraceae bacterium]